EVLHVAAGTADSLHRLQAALRAAADLCLGRLEVVEEVELEVVDQGGVDLVAHSVPVAVRRRAADGRSLEGVERRIENHSGGGRARLGAERIGGRAEDPVPRLAESG